MDTIKHPEWRNAVQKVMELNPKPGDTIKRAWLEELFELPEARNALEFQARQFKWLQQFEQFRDELLIKHQIWIRSDSAGGYVVVPPSQQTELACSDYTRMALLKLKRGARISQHVKLDELTDEERRRDTDLRVKMSMLVGMIGGAFIEDKRAPSED